MRRISQHAIECLRVGLPWVVAALVLLAISGCGAPKLPSLPSLDDAPIASPGSTVFREVSALEGINFLGPWFGKTGQKIVPVAKVPRQVTREELEQGIRSDIETEREAAERRGRERSWAQLSGWATWLFLPGVGLLVASVVLPTFSSFRATGVLLTGGGVLLAIVPWIGQALLPSFLGPAKIVIGAGMFGGAALLAFRVWSKQSVKHRISDIREDLAKAQIDGDDERVRLLASSVVALSRADDPTIDNGGWRMLPEGQIITNGTGV